MSATLAEVNASAGNDVIIRTLDLNSAPWSESIFICNGFEDQTCTDENGRVVDFTAVNFDAVLAAKDAKGNQTLAFALDNTTGEVSRKTDLSTEANARVTAVYRTFLESNRDAPAEVPYRLNGLSMRFKGLVAEAQCGYFNMIGVKYPRNLYTTDFAPALRYI